LRLEWLRSPHHSGEVRIGYCLFAYGCGHNRRVPSTVGVTIALCWLARLEPLSRRAVQLERLVARPRRDVGAIARAGNPIGGRGVQSRSNSNFLHRQAYDAGERWFGHCQAYAGGGAVDIHLYMRVEVGVECSRYKRTSVWELFRMPCQVGGGRTACFCFSCSSDWARSPPRRR